MAIDSKWLRAIQVTKSDAGGPDLDLMIETHKEALRKAQDKDDTLNARHHAQQIDALLPLKKKQEKEGK